MNTILKRPPRKRINTEAASDKPAARANDQDVENLIRSYGDIVFDLCESILQNSGNAQIAFREIFHEVRKRRSDNFFDRHERAWVLRVACEHLKKLITNPQGLGLAAAQQIELDSAPDASARLARFQLIFRRLSVADQILLLLKDKYGIPMPEIATALDTPEESLKVQRAQAFRSIEDWIWSAP